MSKDDAKMWLLVAEMISKISEFQRCLARAFVDQYDRGVWESSLRSELDQMRDSITARRDDIAPGRIEEFELLASKFGELLRERERQFAGVKIKFNDANARVESAFEKSEAVLADFSRSLA